MQIASEESKLAEVSKLQETLKLREADLETIKSACNMESNKNVLLQNKLDHTLKELESFKIDLDVSVELKKENLCLKVGQTYLLHFNFMFHIVIYLFIYFGLLSK